MPCLSGPLTTRTQIKNTVQGKPKLLEFLNAVIPNQVSFDKHGTSSQGKQEFIDDVSDGIDAATMAVRITSVSLLRPLSFVPVHSS